MDRRSFIKLTAVTGTSATLASCGNPENQLIRFVPDDDLVPGIAEWKPSICPLCASGCGLNVRVMEADVEVTRGGQAGVVKMAVAKKLEGNAAHPINRGTLCARGQAAIQVTYHPDRLTQPLKRVGPRGSQDFQPITWDEAITTLVGRLDTLASANDQKSLAVVTRPRSSHRQDLLAEFLTRFGAPAPVTYELFDEHVLRRANLTSFGFEQLPTVDMARARYVLAFGADLLGTWNSPVAQSLAYGAMRQGRPGVRGKLVQVEQRMSQTGANADEWVPVAPATEGVLALGIAHLIMSSRQRPAAAAGRAGAAIAGWSSGLPEYTPEHVSQLTGVSVARLERLAREFAEQTPAVAVIGGAPLAQTNGMFHALAVNALNALVGSVGQPGGVFFTPRVAQRGTRPAAQATDRASREASRSLQQLVTDPEAAVQLLLVDDVNPVFSSPVAWRIRETFEKVPFIVSFGHFLDETSVLADLVLPDHSFLESWVDAIPESGVRTAVHGVAAPAMRPLYQTRSMPDVLLEAGRKLSRPLNPPLPWDTYNEMLNAAFSALPTGANAAADETGDDRWDAARQNGGWWGRDDMQAVPVTSERQPEPVAFAAAQFDGNAGEYPLHLLPYASIAFLDGSLAHLPWLQELPDPLTSAMWSNWIEINPRTADTLKIAQGDMVEVTSQHGAVRAPALLSPGIAPDVVAMPVGQGHQTFTRYASGRGSNPVAVLAPVQEPQTGSLAWAATRVRLTRVGEGNGELILFAGEMREHPNEDQGR